MKQLLKSFLKFFSLFSSMSHKNYHKIFLTRQNVQVGFKSTCLNDLIISFTIQCPSKQDIVLKRGVLNPRLLWHVGNFADCIYSTRNLFHFTKERWNERGLSTSDLTNYSDTFFALDFNVDVAKDAVLLAPWEGSVFNQ